MIVADATTLIVLSNLNRLDLLGMFESLLVPAEVYKELTAKKDFALPPFCEIVDCKEQLYSDLLHLLDPGESEAIALARSRDLPLLIDEKKGRRVAKDLGIVCMGFVGLLCLAIQKDLVSKDEALSLLDHAVAKGFRISRKLWEEFARRC